MATRAQPQPFPAHRAAAASAGCGRLPGGACGLEAGWHLWRISGLRPWLRVVPAGAAKSGGHPAKRTFQALRIEVNEELEVLERAVPAAVEAIALGGRIVVMSYHSLEDKIVKSVFQARSENSRAASARLRAVERIRARRAA